MRCLAREIVEMLVVLPLDLLEPLKLPLKPLEMAMVVLLSQLIQRLRLPQLLPGPFLAAG